MRKNKSFYLNFLTAVVIVSFQFVLISCTTSKEKDLNPEWPEITQETKPWTRWWWHGSAVNGGDLTYNLENLKAAGFGGVEITPIYGVKGSEDQDISFLSKDWMEIFDFTLSEGKRLNLGIDLANASGWPFGGPWISDEEASKNVKFKIYELKEGETLTEKVEFIQEPLVRAVGHRVDISEIKFPINSNENLQELALDQVRFEKSIPLQTIMAYGKNGEVIDLTKLVDKDGKLNWTAQNGDWQLYAVFQGWHGKMVERAGKGGEGNVIDHFSEIATKKFLNVFDENAKDINLDGLRAFFNDSYEVDDASGEANWTPQLFQEFRQLRGYDLKDYLPALFGNDTDELNRRVICDYRETISDLLLERFTKVWGDWSKKYNAAIRNQAHGSPANILDLYAASDIPETEGITPLRIKMASSAGHVGGKHLIACEAATWLDEHFLSDLSEVKQNIDRYFSNGVNHIVYHGTPYSPQNEKWPGWLFYASTHFAPTNTWWEDLKTVNKYIANCQSFLQTSLPANDILLYFPIYDKWSEIGESMIHHFGHKDETLTKELSEMLLQKGFTFDYISDRQIENLDVKESTILSNNIGYKTIIIPDCDYIPLKTIEKLITLADKGANIIMENDFPKSIAGLYNIEEKENAYKKLKYGINFISKENYDECKINNGKIIRSVNISTVLNEVDVYPEELAEEGLWFNKVDREEGMCYFITNWSDKEIDKWIKINSNGKDAVWFNPMNRVIGKAQIRESNSNSSEVYLKLNKGETLILQWYSTEQDIDEYPIYSETKEQIFLSGEWKIEFIKGGPTLPEEIKTTELQSWPEISEELSKFSGTAKYSTTFNLSNKNVSSYLLDLGQVYESAAVFLNGEKISTLIGPTFQVEIKSDKFKETNILEVLVTNLMANRIIDMEKKGEVYKKFYNINLSAKFRENYIDRVFTAKHWEPLPSGLIGPIKIESLQKKSM